MSVERLEQRYQEVVGMIERTALECGREPDEVALVAVGKRHPVEMIEALYDLGHRDFGENYVQELVAKAEALQASGRTEARWHFIGHLQTNKINALMPHVHTVQTVDRAKLARALDSRADRPLSIFIEVNLDGEASKAGVSPDEVAALVEVIRNECSNLKLEGLMCIPDPEKNHEGSAFDRLRSLANEMKWHDAKFSMGMSADYEDAVIKGSHFVRVGTQIFGPRPG